MCNEEHDPIASPLCNRVLGPDLAGRERVTDSELLVVLDYPTMC